MNKNRFVVFSLVLIGMMFSCDKGPKFSLDSKGKTVPVFNADSAFYFIEKQLEPGPRVPNTEAHQTTKTYLIKELKRFIGKAQVGQQKFSQVVYGDTLNMSNIIAVINPSMTDRIMLCAHWDSRPYASEASTEELKKQAVLGADDGASGVAVLMELARIMGENNPEIGVDILLFDGEDYGKPTDLDHYFLGSRFWAQNQPVKNYRPRFGILLDMVGAKKATFLKERISYDASFSLVDGVWKIASDLGYENIFVDKMGAQVADDHYILNRYLSFPTIDIINHAVDFDKSIKFPDHWHTENDNLEIIDKQTLKSVGQVLLELIYNRIH